MASALISAAKTVDSPIPLTQSVLEMMKIRDNILAFFNGTLPTSSGGRFFFTDNTFGGFNDGAGNYFDVNNPNAAGKLYTLKPCTWSFVTITLSPSGYTLYINGVAQTQKSFDSSATGTFNYADAIQKICSYNNMCLGMGS